MKYVLTHVYGTTRSRAAHKRAPEVRFRESGKREIEGGVGLLRRVANGFN